MLTSKKSRVRHSLVFFMLGSLWLAVTGNFALAATGSPAIQLPSGFELQVFASDLPDARGLALADDGTVFVGSTKAGQVYRLKDTNNDGIADSRSVIAKSLTLPVGIGVYGNDLYVMEVSRLLRFPDVLKQPQDSIQEFEEVYDWFPRAIYQGWKPMKLGPDGKFYFAIGAPCDRCQSHDDRMATLARLTPDGDDFEIVAHGVRFSGGFDWHPKSQSLYFTDSAPVRLATQHSLAELNVMTITGLHFGFPYCHGGLVVDPEFKDREECAEYEKPILNFPKQSHPQDVLFYRGKMFPEKYQGKLFLALQGEWNSPSAAGFKIVIIDVGLGETAQQEDFATGWLGERGQIRGQPTDLLELADGSLLVSDEYRGMVYRIVYHGENRPSTLKDPSDEEPAGMCYPSESD